MIDISEETVLSFPEASKSLPNRPNVSTLWRWHQRGLRGVHLETICLGGKRYTSQQALQRFFSQLTAGSTEIAPVAPSREKQFAAAEKSCADWGV